MKVRVQFTKHGAMKYIGHLDMMRFFQKAVRRADIPIRYTEGFSPHQVMSFAAPLGVGLESDGEYFDIELETLADREHMMDRLNAEMCDGVRIKSMVLLPEGASNAMASVAAASYDVMFREGKTPAFDVAAAILKLMEQDAVPYTKLTKKSEIELDLKAGIYSLSGDNGCVHMMVDASSSGNIKPVMIMEALYKSAGETVPEFAFDIVRRDTYTKDGEGNLIPLSAVGENLYETDR